MAPTTRRARAAERSAGLGMSVSRSMDLLADDVSAKHFNKTEILSCLHPLEVGLNISRDEMTIEQRMVSFCMKINGGKATEEQMIQFLTNHFDMMQDQSIQPNRRVLRSILISQINKKPLFARCAYDRQKWTFNTIDVTPVQEAPSHHTRETVTKNTELTFQDALVKLIKESKYGLPIGAITEEAKSLLHLNGSFHNLPLERRVKACLKAKSASKEIMYDNKMMLWTCESAQKRFHEVRDNVNEKMLPPEMNDVQISKISVTDLYDFLKSKGIF